MKHNTFVAKEGRKDWYWACSCGIHRGGMTKESATRSAAAHGDPIKTEPEKTQQ